MTAVQNDPDRVTHPLRRMSDGTFERVSWDEALSDIGARLRAVLDREGGDGVAWYFNNRFVASALLYGSPLVVPIPDLARTDLLLIVGTNPLVSHGSVLTAPRIKDELHGLVARGGRIVVVDPRRSETAREFEHVEIRPDGDAWMLLSLLQVTFAEGLEDSRAIAAQSRGIDALRALVAAHPPEATEQYTGIPADVVRALARDIDSRRACGRVRPDRRVPWSARNARVVPARRAQPGHGQPRPRGGERSSERHRSRSRICCIASGRRATRSSTLAWVACLRCSERFLPR
jgi:anaerobic selenocysteine-containing dehydrogenase